MSSHGKVRVSVSLGTDLPLEGDGVGCLPHHASRLHSAAVLFFVTCKPVPAACTFRCILPCFELNGSHGTKLMVPVTRRQGSWVFQP